MTTSGHTPSGPQESDNEEDAGFWTPGRSVAALTLGTVVATTAFLGAAGYHNDGPWDVDPGPIDGTSVTVVDGHGSSYHDGVRGIYQFRDWQMRSTVEIQRDINTGQYRAVGMVQSEYTGIHGKTNRVYDSDVQYTYQLDSLQLQANGVSVSNTDNLRVTTNGQVWYTPWVAVPAGQQLGASMHAQTYADGGWHETPAESGFVRDVVTRGQGVALVRVNYSDASLPTNLSMSVAPPQAQPQGLSQSLQLNLP